MSFSNPLHHRGDPRASSEKQLLTGRGIGIAFLDTGISPVADFITPQNRIVAFRDFIGGKRTPYDDNGHGTHVTEAFLRKKAPISVDMRAFLRLCVSEIKTLGFALSVLRCLT